MLVLYFNNIVAVVLEHYKKKKKETIKQTSNAKKLWEPSSSVVERYCIFPKMYCCDRA